MNGTARAGVADLVESLLVSFLAAKDTVERRRVSLEAMDRGVAATLIVCDRCAVTRTMLGITRHLNVSELEHAAQFATDVDPRPRLHKTGDLRMATELERLEYEHTERGTR